MDFKEKLEKSEDAQTYFVNTNIRAEPVPYDERFKKGFIRGVEWLQSQPLADRLTDDEKAKIRALYNGETFGELDFIELVSTRRIFKNLFGSELFEGEDKNEEEN